MVTRLTDQKGLDLVAQAADRLLSKDVQLCVLGSGEAKYESWLTELAKKLPEKVAVRIGFDDALAHRIEAGADCFSCPAVLSPAASTRCTA